MTPAGIEPATFRFVAQHLNHCATAVPGLIDLVNNFNFIPLGGGRLDVGMSLVRKTVCGQNFLLSVPSIRLLYDYFRDMVIIFACLSYMSPFCYAGIARYKFMLPLFHI